MSFDTRYGNSQRWLNDWQSHEIVDRLEKLGLQRGVLAQCKCFKAGVYDQPTTRKFAELDRNDPVVLLGDYWQNSFGLIMVRVLSRLGPGWMNTNDLDKVRGP